MKVRLDSANILDFDVEARPLSWYGGDFVSKEVTAIAARWIGDPKSKTMVWLLHQTPVDQMFDEFADMYDYADIVTGHFIRGFDLPLINAALVELNLGRLPDKLTQDTKLDLVKRHGMSGSLENLASDFGLRGKVDMTQADWRAANRGTAAGVARVRERVVEDVDLHIRLREVLLDQGLLRPPVKWTAESAGRAGRYSP